MKNGKCLLLIPVLALAAAACGGGEGGSETPVVCQGASLVGSEQYNYTFSSTLTFPPIKVQPNAELTFDWSAVTEDFIHHAVNPKTDLSMISVLMWDLTLPELQTKLNADSLEQRDLTVVPLTFLGDGATTSAKLFSFDLNGNPVDSQVILSYFDAAAYPADTHTYTVIAASGTTVGQGARMIQSFQLDPTSTNTTVAITNQSTVLNFTADLTALEATGVPAGTGAITLDWAQLTKNALNNEFDSLAITAAFVGQYNETPAELSGQKFLDLELIATKLYRGAVQSGTSITLSTLKDQNGSAFTGIDATGTWLVGLQCGNCRNPAPWYIAVLKPCQS